MVDLVIFDCDGVLVDSEVLSADALIAELRGVGLEITREDVRKHFLGRSFPTVAAMLSRDFGAVLPPSFEADYRARLLRDFEDRLTPTPGLSAVLSEISVPVCVATSSSPARTKRALEVAGLSAHFGPHVFTASEVAHGKPAPDLFLHAAARMGARPRDSLVIEDSVPGLEAAEAAGIPSLRFVGGAHLAGETAELPAGTLGSFDNWRELAQVCPSLFREEQDGAQLER